MAGVDTPMNKRPYAPRRRSLVGGEGGSGGGEDSSQESPKVPKAEAGKLEARQKAFSVKVANFKPDLKQKLPTAYSKLVNEFKDWREKRPQQLRDYIKERNKSNRSKVNVEDLVADRVKGHKEAGECLSKLLEANP